MRRAVMMLGFPLGGMLAVAIQAAAFLAFFDAGVTVEHISQTALQSHRARQAGLIVAIVRIDLRRALRRDAETLFSLERELHLLGLCLIVRADTEWIARRVSSMPWLVASWRADND